MAVAGTFNPDAALAQWQQGFDGRKQRAAQHLLSALLSNMPVKKGAMRASAKVRLTKLGFLLIVEEFYSFFVDQGHRTSKDVRRASAQAMRSIAKELRRIRKETGDNSSQVREKELKTAAKRKLEESDKRRFVPGLEFVKRTIDEEREAVIAILSGTD